MANFWMIRSKNSLLSFTMRSTKKQCIGDHVRNNYRVVLLPHEECVKVKVAVRGSPEEKAIDSLKPETRLRILMGLHTLLEIPAEGENDVQKK